MLLFGSGVILILSTPGEGGSWRQIHTLSFILWFFLMTSHVLTHLLRSLSLSVSDMLGTSKQIVPGGLERRMLVVGSIILGVVVAIVFLLWDSTWAHWLNTYRQGG